MFPTDIRYARCLFEQSGTFKFAFEQFGIKAFDYDINDSFGETNYKLDLFDEIEKAYIGKFSVFDYFTSDDLLIAFFPCTYFSSCSDLNFKWNCKNFNNLSDYDKSKKILDRIAKRDNFLALAVKLYSVCKFRNLRLILENPFHESYLVRNFVAYPDLIDYDRTLRGDNFPKPTAYWFVNCKRTYGYSFSYVPSRKVVNRCNGFARSIISRSYAFNFLKDFVFGSDSDIQSELELIF